MLSITIDLNKKTLLVHRYGKNNTQDGAKLTLSKGKFEYLYLSSSKRADFFTKDSGMFTLQIHTDKISGNLC